MKSDFFMAQKSHWSTLFQRIILIGEYVEEMGLYMDKVRKSVHYDSTVLLLKSMNVQ